MQLTGPGVWGPPPDHGEALRLLRRAVDLGVDFFDTADAYGPEECELLVAEALHPYRDVIVATKGGLRRHGPGRWSQDARPEHLRAACEGSLRRLRVDCIELYQLHSVDPAVPLEESLGALAELRAEGKIRRIGICNVTPAELDRALMVVPVVSVQNRFSVADRSAEHLLARCEAQGLAFVAWAPLAKGYRTRQVGGIGRAAAARGATPGQLALAWLLARSPVTIPIPGTRSPAHLEENVAAVRLQLDTAEVAALARPLPGYEARVLARRLRVGAGRVKSAVRRLRA
jgi:aryl-alcohol dehydrogenase-like predicted oxidoreductase